jgi:uncharacterized protein YndB with AHSA1/START domain
MPDIQLAIQIASNPETIYPLIATAKGFSQWWAADITEAAQAVELGFFGRSTIYRLRLAADSPPNHADWICETGDEWSGTHITFRLETRGAGTFVRFTHGGWQAATDYFVSCTATWGELMYRLKSAAEGKPRGPLFLANDLAY